MLRRRVSHAVFAVTIAAVILVWILPLAWMALSSFKPSHQIIAQELIWTFTPTLEHYRTIFQKQPFIRFTANSVIVALTVTAVTMVAGSLAAYGIARFGTGGRPLLFWIMLTRTLPPAVLVIPLFLIFRVLGLINTLTALVIADTTFLLSFVVWSMRGFFGEVPSELEEAALVDGGTRLQALLRVVLPVVLPGLIATATLTFIFAWNEYLFALVFAIATPVKTLPVAAGDFVTGYAVNWGPVFASGTLIMVPVFVFSILLQRFVVRGLTMGAIR